MAKTETSQASSEGVAPSVDFAHSNLAAPLAVKGPDSIAALTIRESFKREAEDSWSHYQRTGRHLTGEQVGAWLKTWVRGDEPLSVLAKWDLP